ncbi:DUF947-domain-containing protein [Rhizopogon vinicolor AM-OR11-026]|uniref:rRNA biogenesis protein RRP36 n=1 Tax=Rhizopogon vinicolor AM-OR11-026 TaxID=1314800 RepID=A0A1B7N1P6_9AGAM|nr:DUF947-domain-containing protein [Rhizopogon vinicolor AM-OR11-026]
MLHKTRPPKLQKRLPLAGRIPLKSASRHTQPKSVHFSSVAESEQHDESEASSVSGSGSESVFDEGVDAGHDEDEDEDEDADAPRVVQWVDVDSEAESQAEDEIDHDDTHDIPSSKPSRDLSSFQRSLEDDLSSLPLGMLRKAQRTLAQARALSDSESESNASSENSSASDDDEPPRSTTAKGKGREKLERDPKIRKDLAKRSSKHAPTEITSKRPVSRRRTVVESKAPQPRDPRFLHITGDYKPEKFREQYNFLSSLHSNELKTLRESLKRARKLLANSPHDLRAEREREVGRLELAVKRGESTVNRDKREKVETDALQKATREEREKRQHGKAGWWMKASDKKELLMKARYEEIASSGGKRAVKKAIEKKQKKISQKEKKSRPFPASQAGDSAGGGQKRPARFALAEERSKPSKRRKFV